MHNYYIMGEIASVGLWYEPLIFISADFSLGCLERVIFNLWPSFILPHPTPKVHKNWFWSSNSCMQSLVFAWLQFGSMATNSCLQLFAASMVTWPTIFYLFAGFWDSLLVSALSKVSSYCCSPFHTASLLHQAKKLLSFSPWSDLYLHQEWAFSNRLPPRFSCLQHCDCSEGRGVISVCVCVNVYSFYFRVGLLQITL